MAKFVTGIDDIATMNGISKGWTIISFNADYFEDFNKSATDILKSSELHSFHAKDFKRKKETYYQKFLELIRTTISKGENSFLCCTLLDALWETEFKNFCDYVIEGAFNKAQISDNDLLEASKKIAAPLFTYLRLSSKQAVADSTSIDIDSDSILKGLATGKLIQGTKICNQVPIFAALKAYQQKQFPSAPLIEKKEINVLNDENSFLIQAADVFGNFSTAKARQALGITTKTNDLKCKIFDSVFEDLIDTSKLNQQIEIAGEDIKLKQAGSLTLCIK